MHTSQQDSSDNPKFHTQNEYESMSFEKRRQYGLLVDRSYENTMEHFWMFLKETKNQQEIFLDNVNDLYYRDMRHHNSWHIKRQVNAMLLDKSNAHKNLIDQSRPILLDMMMSKQPTEKDWIQFSASYKDELSNDDESRNKLQEKSVRRTMNRFPNVISKFIPEPIWKFKKDDGSYVTYPNWPEREDQRKNNKRLTNIATAYSLPPNRGRLDAASFVDVNCMIRFDKYWRDILSVMSEILQSHGPIRPEMEWFVYHIVNKDVGLYVLFDNLSIEYESRWFRTLSENTQMQIAGLPGIQSEPYWFTSDDAKKGILQLKKFVQDFEDIKLSSPLQQYKISQKTMKKRMHELALASADAYLRSNNSQQYEFIMNEITKNF